MNILIFQGALRNSTIAAYQGSLTAQRETTQLSEGQETLFRDSKNCANTKVEVTVDSKPCNVTQN
jgi:hypothetical protein